MALQAALVGKLHHAAALDAVAPLSEARARLLPKLSARLRDERFAVAMVRGRVRVRVRVRGLGLSGVAGAPGTWLGIG